jgi:hypothetical protein
VRETAASLVGVAGGYSNVRNSEYHAKRRAGPQIPCDLLAKEHDIIDEPAATVLSPSDEELKWKERTSA